VEVATSTDAPLDARLKPAPTKTLIFSENLACIECGISYPEMTPRMFSFNNPHGACPECTGLGTRMYFDPELVVPNPELSLREGAIAPWEKRLSGWFHQILEALAKAYDFDIRTPFKASPSRCATHHPLRIKGRENGVLVGGGRGPPPHLSQGVRRGAEQSAAPLPRNRVGIVPGGDGEVHERHALPHLPGRAPEARGAARAGRRQEHQGE
jgi:hypothetical protein